MLFRSCADDAESEIVKLELLELARSAMQQYATKFKTDGITQEEMTALYDTVAEQIRKIETTTDLTAQKRAATIALLDDTRQAIAMAYATGIVPEPAEDAEEPTGTETQEGEE